MGDLNRMARMAVRRHGLSHSLDYDDRLATAWHGIVDELFVSPEFPAQYRLVVAGLRELDKMVSEHRHHHGLADAGQPAPKFDRYWRPISKQRTDDGFSDHLLEILALPRVLSVLTPDQYEAIVTLAAFDNVVADAAAALGMKYHGFYYRVLSARAKIRAVWFDDETPPQAKKAGETCRSGHNRAEHGVQKAAGVWECRRCKRSAERRRRAAA
ncbi:MAG TPA: hypothetical protein VGE38_08575 [Nocardioides sp.]|uniref:hypothetical protein n=1 Tax=Nocardioides sp. TaxID=35761 RepID=UPI002ED9C7B6